MGEPSITINLSDIPEDIRDKLKGTFFPTFHKYDIWKDALAKPRVDTRNRLFEQCMKNIFGVTALNDNGATGSFKKLENTMIQNTNATTYPINLLKDVKRMSTPETRHVIIPASIKYAIRDTGGIRKVSEFSSELQIISCVSDYSDPGTKTSEEYSKYFPSQGTQLKIADDLFEFMLGKKIITEFTSSIDSRDLSCSITFKIYEHAYNIQIDNNYFAVSEDAIMCTGNPTKNKWFNSTLTINSENINKGIAYLMCKEMFGDVLIGLIALKYASIGNSDAAVFTGDNGLTALCLALKVSVVSKLRDKNKVTSNNTAYMFTDKETMLINEKIRELDSIIKHNMEFNSEIAEVVSQIYQNFTIDNIDMELIRFKGTGKGKMNLIPFFEYLQSILQDINKYLQDLKDQTTEEAREFMNDFTINHQTFKYSLSKYKISSIFRKMDKKNHTLKLMNMHNPFKGLAIRDSDYLGILENKMMILDKLKLIMSTPRELLAIQSGGAIDPTNTSPYSSLKERDDFFTEEEEEDPSEYLLNVIRDTIPSRIIGQKYENGDIYTGNNNNIELDPYDIYHLLYKMYEVYGTICYSPSFIRKAVDEFLNQVESANNPIDFYKDYLDLHIDSKDLPSPPLFGRVIDEYYMNITNQTNDMANNSSSAGAGAGSSSSSIFSQPTLRASPPRGRGTGMQSILSTPPPVAGVRRPRQPPNTQPSTQGSIVANTASNTINGDEKRSRTVAPSTQEGSVTGSNAGNKGPRELQTQEFASLGGRRTYRKKHITRIRRKLVRKTKKHKKSTRKRKTSRK